MSRLKIPQGLDWNGPRQRRGGPAWSLFWVFAALFVIFASRAPAQAAELVMFESETCMWCETWHEEIGPTYPKTAEARIAPLRRVDVDDDPPADLRHLKAVIYTPTFVLMHGDREVGRILGYPGEDFFWGLLEEMLGKLAQIKDDEGRSPQARMADTVICGDGAEVKANQGRRMSC